MFGRWLGCITVTVLVACAEESTETAGTKESKVAQPPSAASEPTADSSETSIRFRDALADSGIGWKHEFLDNETGTTYRLNPYDHGSGVLVADVDGDGRDDLYFLNFLGGNALYRSLGGGKFEDITAGSNVEMTRSISVGGCFADIDNDGDQDLYVTTYRNGNRLFRNAGDGTFEDVSEVAGVAHLGHSNSATFFDYDQDGDQDLYLTNIGSFTTETINEQVGYYYEGVALNFDAVAEDTDRLTEGERNVLWRNRGDGTFEDVTDAAGVSAPSWNGDCSVSDYDGDGDLDLYVANMFGPNHLYRNEGDGTFVDQAETALERTTWGAIGCRFFDADNDGRDDLLVADMHSDMWITEDNADGLDPKAKYPTPYGPTLRGRMGQPVEDTKDLKGKVLFGNSFFHNQGDGTFVEMSGPANLETYWPWAVTVGDFDYDGDQDVFFPSGMSYPFFYWPNALMENRGGLSFVDVTEPAGLEPRPGGNELDLIIHDRVFTKSSRTAVVLDFDEDGDLDLVVNNFNDVPHVYANESPKKNWVAVRLVGNGQSTPRDATGSRVTVVAGGMRQTRAVENATGYLSQSTATVYFGIGDAKKLDRVEVAWAGGATEVVTDRVKLGSVNRIPQGP